MVVNMDKREQHTYLPVQLRIYLLISNQGDGGVGLPATASEGM